jgi:hypothetical protein
MIVTGNRATLPVVFFFLFFVPAMVFGKGTKPSGEGGTFLSLYQDQYQNAFYILIPKGWKTEGGMVPSGVQWNVVDLVESNISFRVTSPDGKSFFGWYPRFYFQDPQFIQQSSGGVLQPQIGQVLNGCWIYPFLDVAQYVKHIVFQQFGINEFQTPRLIGNVVKDATLKPWVPKSATRADYGYVNFECMIGGTPMFGRVYTIIYDIQGAIWSTVGTFGWLAPKIRWKEDERIMEMCIRSFRLNPQWVQRASAATRQRARGYNQVIQQMHRIDLEINRQQGRAANDIQEEFYKVITDQIETIDPESGKSKYLPMYNHAYTDGQGNFFLRDYDDGTLPFENAPEWRKLKIINRNKVN